LAAKRLQKLNPRLLVSGYRDTSPSDNSVINAINRSGAKILLVAFGAPAQEIWLSENLKKLPQIRVAMGVGGTFDFIAGIVPRAPQWMRKIGLEWVYRLYRQPRKRLKRIFNAFCVFPWTVIKKRQQHHSASGKSS
jgi:N-acetylglucosaminyldiphosphoundecaprenol N-acetyl-beta-D-mannosaminyltransferase